MLTISSHPVIGIGIVFALVLSAAAQTITSTIVGSVVDPSGAAVGFAAVADAGDLYGLVVLGFEKEPVVAAAEAEAGQRRLERKRSTIPSL